jgi:hypothetical protein
MRMLPSIVLLVTIAASGCAGKKPAATFAPLLGGSVRGDQKVIVTPETGLSGKIVRVNTGGRFVVLNFPVGHLPALDQRLNVYRLGLKVGEVRVTGPQLDDNVVGDLAAGDARVGDDVRDK